MKKELTDKQKYLLRITVASAVVYLVFQYLLPLFLPFLAAVLLALLIRPAALFLRQRFRIPMAVGAGLVLVLVLAVVGISGYYLGRLLLEQVMELGKQVPQLWEQGKRWMETVRVTWEERWQLPAGTSFQGVVKVLRGTIAFVVMVFVIIGATLITTTQLDVLRQQVKTSLFADEIRYICGVLSRVGIAYAKTQLVIMAVTVVISGVGLTLLRNPYALLWAVAIGLVDALPLFGAGTILWPWFAWSLFQGRWGLAVGLAVIYGICNLIRQWLEARYMGDRIGISPLANLASMYVGLKLFGILGLFLGPIGFLLVKESGQITGDGKKGVKSS